MKEKLSLELWLQAADNQRLSFADFCIQEQCRSLSVTEEAFMTRLLAMLTVMEESIAFGLTGVKSKGGLVGGDAQKLQEALSDARTVGGTVMSQLIIKALAVAEANAAMGRIVAAPTAGSSGVLPAVLFTLAEVRNLSRQEMAKGLAVAGNIGMVIASRASLAGAEGGCQAECGSAAAMAAGAAVTLCGGDSSAIGHAAAIALKNLLGLVCDPVAGLVEVPCVKRNVGAAVQAMAAAEMALAGIESVIPVDQVIDSMASIGAAMPCALKETAQGGLAVSPAGLEWNKKLFGK
ncbi:L-serine ammonia-lyase, iron-sulfur-dependent, subunit alpha [Acetonema longum]|uniref:L-serine dehydratase n=1 Tax=Acetonema longum DSM 6540 TaxID=1009370 RepID=F7NM93_9FIRM|nr:L-serine ammonia-lyase, iron-sulfur-dependent, subunit alpha [Acetonema longum]EGO62831.1 L-serine dehydratase, iron-sulfur-dependent subunit alpha [Acetonema longum DSM 6540]